MEINKNFGIFPWDKEGAVPYFMNEKNIEWWFDESATKWAHEDMPVPGVKGVKNLIVFILRQDGKPLTRIVMDAKTNEVIYENQSLEGIACWLDVYKATKDWDND